MLNLVLPILFLLLASVGFGIGAVKKSYTTYEKTEVPVRKISWIVGSVFLFLGLVSLFFSSFTVVNATQVGVPVAFGHVGKPLDNGVHFVAPWANVEEYPIRPITVQLVGQDAVIARTADAGQMTVELAARWRVERQDASTLYYQSRTGDLSSITDNIVLPNLRQAVGQIYSVTGNLDAISNRDKVAEEIRVQLNKQLIVYGITVDTVSMRSVEPDRITAATISQYASQQQATRIATEATKTATIEAERRLIEAKGIDAAGKAVSNLTTSQLAAVCIQVWQQTINSGLAKGVPVYTNPCSNSSSSLIVSAK